MPEFLAAPLVQFGVAPFVMALLVALLLRRAGWYWAGLAVPLGFSVAVYLLNRVDLFSPRENSKLLLCSLGGAALALVLDIYPWGRRWIAPFLFLAIGGVGVWLAWPFIQHSGDLLSRLTLGGGALLFCGWMAAAMEGLRDEDTVADSAALSASAGVAFAMVFSEATYLAQVSGALAATTAARWLLGLGGKEIPAGSLVTLTVGAASSFVAYAAVLSGKLQWFCLPLLALIPLLSRVPVPKGMSRWLKSFVLLVMNAIPAGLVVYLTWKEAGGPSLWH